VAVSDYKYAWYIFQNVLKLLGSAQPFIFLRFVYKPIENQGNTVIFLYIFFVSNSDEEKAESRKQT